MTAQKARRRILIAEKDIDFIARLTKSMTDSFEVEIVDTVQALEKNAQLYDCDAILLNLDLVEKEKLDTIAFLRKEIPTIPLIILLNESNPELEEKIIKSGVQDCVVKKNLSFDLLKQLLEHTIVRHAYLFEDKEEDSKEQIEKLKKRVNYDDLTGLMNRSQFERFLKKEIFLAQQYNRFLSLFRLDIDNFKSINDTLGHEIGDKLLKAIALSLKQNVRKTDLVARLGSDEFGVLLRGIRRTEDAAQVANKILAASKTPYQIDSHEIYITFTIGIANFPEHGKGWDELFKNADIALNRAKEQGKNSCEYFSSEYRENYTKKAGLVNDLNLALERNEFFLVYQPRIELSNKKISGIEALIRWQHPKLGLILPDDFVFLAEKNNLIGRIGEWVLRKACQQYQKWRQAGYHFGRLAVNLSAVQMNQSDFINNVSKILKETDMKPGYLEFELTESTVMTNLKIIEPILHQLDDMGIHIAIDDFGTGYSSFSRLNTLPVHTLKIDKAFIQDLGHSSADKIVRTMIQLAKNLDLYIVAEGVETEKQLQFLMDNHCDCVQGYYLSHPLTVNQMEDLLKKNSQS